jgi:hypothetical protein
MASIGDCRTNGIPTRRCSSPTKWCERSLAPEHFINPSLHAYTTYVAVRLAYALAPRQALRYQLAANAEVTNPDHPDRPILFLAFRLARLFSLICQLATVLLIFGIARHAVDETTGFVAAWFAAVTMGFVNMAHFATGESLLFLLSTWALWRCSYLAERGWWRDYALAGLAMGLACSTKYTPCVLALPFLVAHFAGRGAVRGFSGTGIAQMALTMVCTIGGFIAASPYAVLAWPMFREGLAITWFTGAPSGSLDNVERSWIPSIGIVANALGWPLCARGGRHRARLLAARARPRRHPRCASCGSSGGANIAAEASGRRCIRTSTVPPTV